MTSPSPSVDSVRERITEIQQRIAIGKERADEDTGDGDAIISAWSMFAAVAEHDTPTLLAALTAVLDLHQPKAVAWGRAQSYAPSARRNVCAECCRDWPCATYSGIAAGLGVTP